MIQFSCIHFTGQNTQHLGQGAMCSPRVWKAWSCEPQKHWGTTGPSSPESTCPAFHAYPHKGIPRNISEKARKVWVSPLTQTCPLGSQGTHLGKWIPVWRHSAPGIPWISCLHTRTHTGFPYYGNTALEILGHVFVSVEPWLLCLLKDTQKFPRMFLCEWGKPGRNFQGFRAPEISITPLQGDWRLWATHAAHTFPTQS